MKPRDLPTDRTAPPQHCSDLGRRRRFGSSCYSSQTRGVAVTTLKPTDLMFFRPMRQLATFALAIAVFCSVAAQLPSAATPSGGPPWATRAIKLLADLPVEPPASMAG